MWKSTILALFVVFVACYGNPHKIVKRQAAVTDTTTTTTGTVSTSAGQAVTTTAATTTTTANSTTSGNSTTTANNGPTFYFPCPWGTRHCPMLCKYVIRWVKRTKYTGGSFNTSTKKCTCTM